MRYDVLDEDNIPHVAGQEVFPCGERKQSSISQETNTMRRSPKNTESATSIAPVINVPE
jgi:hypothetical protein